MKLQIQKWFRNFCDENFVLSQCFFGGKTPNLLECILNNAITDGGVAPPTILLTIVMMSSNLKSLRISRNSKYSSRIVGSAQSAFAPAALSSSFAPAALRSAYAPAALRLILIIDL